MQYTFAKACLLALAATSSVVAQIPGFNVLTAPKAGEVLEAGSTYTIKWTPSDPAGPISLIIMEGKTNISLDLGDAIAEGIDSSLGKYDWAVPADAKFAAYGILLQLDSDNTQFQYSNQFTISGGADDDNDDDKDVTTVHISEASTTSTKSHSSHPTSKATTTAETSLTSATSETITAETSAPSTTDAPSTTMETSTMPANSTETGVPKPTQTSPANRNAVVGGGLVGAMVMVLALF